MFAQTFLLATMAAFVVAAPATPVHEIAARQSGAAAGGLASLLGGAGGAGGLVSLPIPCPGFSLRCFDSKGGIDKQVIRGGRRARDALDVTRAANLRSKSKSSVSVHDTGKKQCQDPKRRILITNYIQSQFTNMHHGEQDSLLGGAGGATGGGGQSSGLGATLGGGLDGGKQASSSRGVSRSH